MKRRVTKESLVSYIKTLDKRFNNFTDEEVDEVLNDGFAELCTIVQPFASQVTESLSDYYEFGETVFDINIQEDVSDVYDFYLSKENQDESIFDHGVYKNRDKNRIYKDAQNSDLIHVDISYDKYGLIYELAVVKYFYIPTSNFDELFIGSDVYLALKAAFALSSFEYVQDVENSERRRAAMERRAGLIANPFPSEYEDLDKPNMFPLGV